MKTKRKFRRHFIYLPPALLSLITTGYIFFSIDPSQKIRLLGLQIPSPYLFFASLILFIFFLGSSIFASRLQGLILSSFSLAYILLRISGLTHPLFLILILALLVTVELFLRKKK